MEVTPSEKRTGFIVSPENNMIPDDVVYLQNTFKQPVNEIEFVQGDIIDFMMDRKVYLDFQVPSKLGQLASMCGALVIGTELNVNDMLWATSSQYKSFEKSKSFLLRVMQDPQLYHLHLTEQARWTNFLNFERPLSILLEKAYKVLQDKKKKLTK
jgi:hypothetical protein